MHNNVSNKLKIFFFFFQYILSSQLIIDNIFHYYRYTNEIREIV